jgi:biopolymer transport protein ExbD
MAFGSSKSRQVIPIVEMTPMIDIIFLLIIFFMVAAQFAQQARVDLELPKEQGEVAELEQENAFIINLLENGEIVVDNSKGVITYEELASLLQEEVETRSLSWDSLLIRADERASTQALNEILLLLHGHNFSATRIATETN